nr:cytidine deaminase [Maliibacterium massiliense]
MAERRPVTDDTLIKMALYMRKRAYAPYSGFRVGAALRCQDGSVFVGCNVENAAYSATCCAERTALFAAVAAGQRVFDTIAIASDNPDETWPCGVCRQALYEFAPQLRVLSVGANGRVQAGTLGALLAHGFGAASLAEAREDRL